MSNIKLLMNIQFYSFNVFFNELSSAFGGIKQDTKFRSPTIWMIILAHGNTFWVCSLYAWL